MSKIRALELAVQLGGNSEVVLNNAVKFAEFLGEEPKAATGKPRKAPVESAAPVIAVDAAANETTAETPPAAAEQKPSTPKPEAVRAPAVTMEEVKALVGKVATNAAAGGAPKAREILGLYGATNISTLKPEKYALAKASLEAVLQAAEDAASVAA